jgi:hypothetical protein
MIRITGSAVGVASFGYNFPIMTVCFTVFLILAYIWIKLMRKKKEKDI